MRHLPRTVLLGSIGLLACTAQPASAAAFGGYASPLGWFTALAALLLIPGWSGHLPGMALVTAGGGLVVAIGAAWLLRWQVSGRALALR
ncbi:MAG: hypothetical protein M3O01_15155, partial [Pseudomonadota bacterium]|nr:hypothetical protein [Pseudomonadota bacterium]